MKKAKWWMEVLGAVCVAVAGVPCWGAYTERVDGVDWRYIVTNGSACVSGGFNYAAPRGNTSIPLTLGGYPVTGIGDNEFSGCTNLTEVVIPNTVTNIGPGAFRNCIGLTNMVIPDSVTGIGNSAFQGASPAIHDTNRIPGVDIVDGWAVGSDKSVAGNLDMSGIRGIADQVFWERGNLESVILSDSLANIGESAFYKCSNLTVVFLPDHLKRIGGRAFALCDRLASVTLGEGLETIGDGAFSNCTRLASIAIPGNVEAVGTHAFYKCSTLADATLSDAVADIGDYAFALCANLASVRMGQGVTNIGNHAFYGCGNMTAAAIPRKVGNIGAYAFYGCTNLTEVAIPASTKDIREYAFYDCRSLSSLLIENGVTNIGSGAFGDCLQLESVTIPESATSIAYGLCNGCVKLRWLILPASWQETPDHNEELLFTPAMPPGEGGNCSVVFGPMHRSGLWTYSVNARGEATVWGGAPDEKGRLVIPTQLGGYPVRQIGSLSFRGADDVTTVVIPEGVTWIGDSAFARCKNLVSVSIPDSMAAIGEDVFYNCPSLPIDAETIPGVHLLDGWVLSCSADVAGGLDLSHIRGIAPYAFWTCRKKITSVVIGEKAKSIGWSAFSGCTNLAAVAISDGVETIGGGAFADCAPKSVSVGNGVALIRSLGTPEEIHIHDLAAWCRIDFCGATRIKGSRLFLDGREVADLRIPDGVSRISDYAFAGCRGVESLTIPGSVECIGHLAFSNCADLASATILGNITNEWPSYGPFTQCSNLESVVLGGSLKTVGSHMFSRCGGLSDVTIGDSVMSIGTEAFNACGDLRSLTLGASVTNMGAWAFSALTNLDRLSVPDLGTWLGITFGSPSANPMRAAKHWFVGDAEVKDLVVADGTPEIGEYAFYQSPCLTSVTVAGGVGNIGKEAFRNSSGLTRATIGGSVTNIGEMAFAGCSNLATAAIGGSVGNIGLEAFYGCPNLAVVDIGDNVTNIEDFAFAGSTGLAVTVGRGVRRIGSNAFAGKGLTVTIRDLAAWCGIEFQNYTANPLYYAQRFRLDGGGDVADLAIPPGVTEIGVYAFYNCSGLSSLTIPDSVTNVGMDAFSHCSGLAEVSIPDGVESVGFSAFANCERLRKATVGKGVTFLGGGAFSYCDNLAEVEVWGMPTNDWEYSNCPFRGSPNIETVVLGGNMAKIGACMFYGSESLSEVTIPEGVTSIGADAFHGCTALATATILGNATNDWSYARGPFSGCTNLGRIVLGKKMTKIGTYMFHGCGKLSEVTIPEGVASVGAAAFSGCTALTTATILGNVTNDWSYGYGPFYGCPNLERVSFGDKATKIGAYMFHGCFKLADVTIPSGVTYIGEHAFYDCKSLASATILGNITNDCQNSPFYGCTNLAAVVLGASMEKIWDGMFAGCERLASVEVLGNVTNDWDYYSRPFYRCTNLETIVLGDEMTIIGSYMFYECGVADVAIPDGVTSIGDSAFGICGELVRVSMGNGVTNIGDHAFAHCGQLSELAIPDGVVRIGEEAFRYCSGLTELVIPESVQSIGKDAFYLCGLKTLCVPEAWRGTDMLTDACVPWSCTVVYGTPKAETVGGVTWRYTVVDGEAMVLSGDYAGDLAIPDTLGGCPVASIGNAAFSGCADLTSITIPDGVASIGVAAFSGCVGLREVEIPPGVAEIGADAFDGCAGLAAVRIRDMGAWCAISFGSHAANPLLSAGHLFLGDEEVADLDVPGGVARIGAYAFCGCTGLASATIPEGVAQIGYQAFLSCDNLSAVRIGDGVADLGDWAFFDCPRLESLEVPGAWYGTDMLGNAGMPEGCEVTYRGVGVLSVATRRLPRGTAGEAYEAVLAARGGVGPYTWRLAGGSYSESAHAGSHEETGTAQGWQGDDFCWELALPFPFPYFGNVYTNAKVSSNGALSLGEGDFPAFGFGEELFRSMPVIAVLWRDLTTEGGDIYVGGGEDSLTVRWKGTDYGDGGAANFSVTLWEDGRIVMKYGEGNANGGTIGLSAGDGVREVFSGRSNSGSMENAEDVVFSSVCLPQGMEVGDDGVFRGTPETAGVYSFGVVVADAKGFTASKTLTWKVVEPGTPPEAEPTTATPVPVPYGWLERYADEILAANDDNYGAAANARAVNGKRVWECYLAGLDPADAGAEFKVKSIRVVDGEAQVEWDPDLREDEVPRNYTVWGTSELGAGVDTWTRVTPGNIKEMRYFAVEVGLGQ